MESSGASGTRGPSDLHSLVHELASTIGGNFQVVPIEGFDELMETFWVTHQQRRSDANAIKSLKVGSPANEPVSLAPTVDMEPMVGTDLIELEWTSMRSRLVNYCNAMDIPLPLDTGRDWVIDRLCKLDLAVRLGNDQVAPTKAGYLLFGRKPQERIPTSKVQLKVNDQEQTVEGNLWNQLDLITNALAELNRPFRLKGDISETVYPYPPLALKEVVVNALVHREYDSSQHIRVQIETDRVQITNPGGLVDEVVRQADGTSILKQIKRGKRGIKGYRNPVIADLFYGAGAMDKEGSGLADVHRLVIDNGGDLNFDPVADNTAFEVVIYSRPEAVDKVTGTASPLIMSTRYASNLLEVLEMPIRVWQAPIIFRRAKDVWAATEAAWLPPFIIHGGLLHTFHDLTDQANPLRDHVDVKDIRVLTTDKFCTGEDGEHKFVWLINECLYDHLEFRGLMVDKKRKRAYFPRTEVGNRMITYQARLRRPSRTVTKKITSPTTNKVRYWEHRGFSFMFERFSDTWALQILPGYVFTLDGWKDFLSGERVNRLSTRRASRDYNSQVHNDLVFWTWVLSHGEPGSFFLRIEPRLKEPQKRGPRPSGKTKASKTKNIPSVEATYPTDSVTPIFVLRSTLPTVTINTVEPLTDIGDDELLDDGKLTELAELEEELARLAEEQQLAKLAGSDLSGKTNGN